MNIHKTISLKLYGLPAIVLIFVCLTVFFNTFANEFVWDDRILITENQHIRDYKNIPLFFTPHYWNALHPDRGLYRPVRAVSLAVDYFFWKLNPFGYHITNILLHIINVVLIFYLVSIMTGKGAEGQEKKTGKLPLFLQPPFLTALFFAVHPIHTESINLIKNRSDLLAFLFFLLSFLLFIKHITGTGRMNRRLLLFGAWFWFVPAVLSKAMALTLPVILALYAICFFSSAEQKKTLFRIVPYIVMILVYFWFMYSFIEPPEPVPPYVPLPADIGQRALTVIKTLGCYFNMLIVPFPLNAERIFGIPSSILEPSVLFSLAVLLLICIGAVTACQRSWILFFSVGWILLTLLPAANIIYLVSRPIAEQRLYIPSFGFCLLLGYGVQRLSGAGAERFNPILSIVAGGLLTGVIVSLYAGITVHRNFDWRDALTFYTRTVAASPTSARMRYNLANALSKAKQYQAAITQYRTALRMKPDYLEAHYNLGITFYEAGRYQEAVSHYKTVLRLEPDNVDALNNLGVVFYDMGRQKDARVFFQDALKLEPDDVKANRNMGDVLFDMGHLEKAAGYYLTALRLQPDLLDVYYKLGEIFMERGEVNKAIQLYSDVLEFYPNDIKIRNELGKALAERRRFEKSELR